ncbi:Zn-dependent hydrolase [Sutterella sp.]|uniref:Zn-dependent hydrolase n=1 Tax=Sutterella sp. TaxID=1981025 RepID=UPI003FD7FCBA
MAQTSGSQTDIEFAGAVFDHVRGMSADVEGVTRQGYSPLETEVLDYLEGIGRELSLEIRRDAAGNVWMTLPGEDRTLPAFVAGSHADSVPQGGNYDGLAGIVAALVAARRMRRDGFTPKRDFTVLMMRCEESSFFGKAYVGSLGMMGRLKASDLALKHRTTGRTLGEYIAACGLDPQRLTTGEPVIDPKRIAAFVELHIEQGPTLTSQKTARTGIVTGIRGNIRHKEVRVAGETAHSGAVNKEYRHDAVLAAARLLSRLDDKWDEYLRKGDDLVFTVGVIKTAPTAAISVIPGHVTFTVDMRSLSADTCRAFHDELTAEAAKIAEARGVRFEFDAPLFTAPAHVDEKLAARLEETARRHGIPVMRLASGAGHDSAVLGNAGIPVAMIFVANQNGSHNPHEAMELPDFMTGAELLWRTAVDFDA